MSVLAALCICAIFAWLEPSSASAIREKRAYPVDPTQNTYLISLAANWVPYDYVNDNGVIEGFQVDVINAACAQAGKDCKIVIGDDYLAFDPTLNYGLGLNNRWFDMSSGWANTVERAMMYDFTGPIIKSKDAHLYRRIGSDFTLDTASRIGFRRAWYTSPYCMKNIYGENFDMSVAVIYYDWEELGLMLQNGEVDLVFATKGKLGEGVEEIETPHSCAEAHSFMHRKDTEFQWMADAIDAIKSDGTYKTFCAKTYRGVKPACVDV